ncbi:YoaK family protein [Microbacterium sp. LWH13-1.2]|uniref:YoaK family protein n=1 Tax=Microbacterium sp. LWH13-1.2 TaxID=3135260 RepID=UPI003138961B
MNRQISIPAALAVIAGVTDVTSWLLLGGFFSAHVTGNLVVMAADVVRGTLPDLASMLAVPVFIVATVAATLVARRIGAHSHATDRLLLGGQAAFLIAAAVLSFTTQASTHPRSGTAILIGMLAVCAMAAQNAYLHLVPDRALSTAVMTGNLVAGTIAVTDIARSRGEDRQARQRWTQTWPLLAGFIGGCLVGAAGAALFGDHAAVLPALLALALFLTTLRPGSFDVPNPRSSDVRQKGA